MKKIINIDSSMDKTEIDKVLKKLSYEISLGKVAILPTSTIYGICTNALNKDSVERIYEIKKRNKEKPLIVLVNGIQMLNKITYGLSNLEEKIINKFWPGPLTLVLKKKKCISNVVTGGKDTVGIRWDSNYIINEIITNANVPIVAPSANISGNCNADSIENIEEEIKEKVDYIVDVGRLSDLKESTLIKVKNENLEILREGKIKKEEILKM